MTNKATGVRQVNALGCEQRGHGRCVCWERRGWFPETVTDERRGARFAFLHVDGDYFETNREVLEIFYTHG